MTTQISEPDLVRNLIAASNTLFGVHATPDTTLHDICCVQKKNVSDAEWRNNYTKLVNYVCSDFQVPPYCETRTLQRLGTILWQQNNNEMLVNNKICTT